MSKKPHFFQNRVIGVLSIVLLPALLWLQARADGNGSSLVQIAAQGYLSNRESFPFLKCEYTIRAGYCTRIEDALAGKFRTEAESRVRWLVDGKKVLYEEKLTEGDVKKSLFIAGANQASSVGALLAPWGQLSDGSYALTYASPLNSANIVGPDNPRMGIQHTPFSFNMMGPDERLNPGRILSECSKGDYHCQPPEPVQVRGEDALRFRVQQVKDGKRVPYFDYYLLPEKGFLPARLSLLDPQNGKEIARGVLIRSQRCSRDRWFPMQTRTLVGVGTSRILVRELTVTKLDVDRRPPSQAFRLSLPSGTVISDAFEAGGWYEVKARRSVGLNELSTIHKQCLEIAKEKRAKGTGAHAGLASYLGASMAVAALLLAICCGYTFWRRRRLLAVTGP